MTRCTASAALFQAPTARRAASRRVAAAALGALATLFAASGALAADSRDYLSKPEVESSLVGRPLVSKNVASGTVSQWEFRRDGTVEASRSGLGRATGTWTLRDDGQMCATVMNRTACRYWFRKDGGYANADTRTPDAVTVAEVRFH